MGRSQRLSPPEWAADHEVQFPLFTRAEASGNLTIPKGTIIESPAIAGVTHRVATLRDAVIPEGQLGIEVDVRAEQAGAAANLGPGYYSILPVPVPGIVTVANGDDWLVSPGSDEETDEAFRSRARAQFQAVGQYHHDAGYRAVRNPRADASMRPRLIAVDDPGHALVFRDGDKRLQ